MKLHELYAKRNDGCEIGECNSDLIRIWSGVVGWCGGQLGRTRSSRVYAWRRMLTIDLNAYPPREAER